MFLIFGYIGSYENELLIACVKNGNPISQKENLVLLNL
jgi:hypothetical protein